LNELDLIVLLQQGDEQAFKKLVDDWQDMVYNTALSIINQEDDADEITQEVFIQVYQSISSFKGDSKLSTWLYRIVISKSLDFLKKKKTKKRFAFVQSLFGMQDDDKIYAKEFHHPGIALENKETAAELFKAMESLPNNQRIAFTLHKLEAQKHAEIAEIMNITITAVESLIARAKVNLKKELQEYYNHNFIK
jgi:RNA polymerase sigma factor (sigma-70 family)